MKKNSKKMLSGFLALALTLGMSGNALAAGDPTVSVTLDGKRIELKDANGGAVQPVMIDGNTYLPVRGISDALGLEVNWDRASREVQLSTSGGTPAGSTQVTQPAVVRLDKGSIMGYNENGIYTFKGVPYGTFERFQYAKPTEAYGTAERPTFALTNGSVSPQSNTRTEYANWAAAAAFMTPSESDMFSTESECLNLNVWTDSLNASDKKPVLVFMHGGGLENGSALELKTYDGKYFADYTNCVFVSVNARLNYVGYLDLTAIGGDANLGVADMVLSLEWVRDNISRFGGDPDNVTINEQIHKLHKFVLYI